jgi:hypothetical protein
MYKATLVEDSLEAHSLLERAILPWQITFLKIFFKFLRYFCSINNRPYRSIEKCVKERVSFRKPKQPGKGLRS